MKVTLIGLGIMGSRMAKNLLKNNVDLTVYNRSAEPIEKLKTFGAKSASSYREAVKDADIVFTMLPNPEVVRQVVLEDCIEAMSPNSLWVDCSTVNPSFSAEAALTAREKGVKFIDAPVAGTLPHAENAELVFFVGGAEGDLKEAEPLFKFMGKKILHIGEQGKGSAYKMLVNGLLAQSMIAFSETVLLGEKMGLDKGFLLNTLPGLVVSAPFTKAKAEMIRTNDYQVMFPLELMHKDLHLAALTAYESGQPLYMLNTAKELFGGAAQAGLGRKDFAAIHEFLSK